MPILKKLQIWWSVNTVLCDWASRLPIIDPINLFAWDCKSLTWASESILWKSMLHSKTQLVMCGLRCVRIRVVKNIKTYPRVNAPRIYIEPTVVIHIGSNVGYRRSNIGYHYWTHNVWQSSLLDRSLGIILIQ